MSKRFPIPEFDYQGFKNMEWRAPAYLPDGEQQRLVAARRAGDAKVFGGYPVQAHAAFYEKFHLKGDNRHVIMCLMPDREVTLLGRSHAWAIQRALVTDSLDAASCKVLFDWKTPRSMNTRLGPEDGVKLQGGVAYVCCGHRYADDWIGNRTIVQNDGSWAPDGNGFRILSAHDEDINDFHACNLSFSWNP
jgi:hypothetical protein